jgi:hypothetical protein
MVIGPLTPEPERPLYCAHTCIACGNPRNLFELGSEQHTPTEVAQKIEQHLATISVHHRWSLAVRGCFGSWSGARQSSIGRCATVGCRRRHVCSRRRRRLLRLHARPHGGLFGRVLLPPPLDIDGIPIPGAWRRVCSHRLPTAIDPRNACDHRCCVHDRPAQAHRDGVVPGNPRCPANLFVAVRRGIQQAKHLKPRQHPIDDRPRHAGRAIETSAPLVRRRRSGDEKERATARAHRQQDGGHHVRRA